MRAVWQEDIVEENNLTVSISALRKALGESIRDHRYIVTIPRRGYTFVAGVAERSDTAVDAHGATAGTHGRSHLLVLPFDLLHGGSVTGCGVPGPGGR